MIKGISKRFMAFVLAVVFSAALVPVMQASAATEIKIGDYVQMGTYYGEPVLWRCVAFEKISGYDENGNPIIDSTDTVTEYQEGYLPLMLSDKIICIKPFDAKTSENGETDSHSRNFNRGNYGSNYWAESNMRSWLNSSAASGDVEWLCGNSPSEDYVENGYNDYADEAGFLTNFTQPELNAVKEVTQKSFVSKPEYENGIYEAGTEGYEYSPNISEIMTNYDTAYSEYVTDKIFLPDIKQADEIYKNSEILGDNYYIGEPTAQCVEKSEYTDSGLAAGSKWHYWLRTPRSDDSNGVRYVYSSNHVYIRSAYRGDSGIRPAFYLNLSAFAVATGTGGEENPYRCYGDNGVYLSTVGKYSDNTTVKVANTEGVVDVELDTTDAEITAEDVTVYAAQYDGDSLVSVIMLTPGVSEGKIVYSGNVTSDTYKVFVWDKEFMPVTYSYENN